MTAPYIRLLLSLGLALALTLPCGARPPRHRLANVPAVAQVDYTGCGAAALAMIFGYWGPATDYMQVVDVVRCMAHGTSLPDMVRGAHFSRRSAAVSEAYPAVQPRHGYGARGLGYGAFFHASRGPWLDELLDVVAQGYPVAVLTDWKLGEAGPHYRVITGYDDARHEIYLADPWPYGKTLEKYRTQTGWTWPYADFLRVWSLSTAAWGLPGGYRYGAVVCAPWKVDVHAPEHVEPRHPFTVEVKAAYRCPRPFGRSAAFPTFPASDVRVTLEAPTGWTVTPPSRTLATLKAGQVTPPLRFTIQANEAGAHDLTVRASGTVRGRVPKWGDTYWNKSYAYTDRIGGEAAVHVTVDAVPPLQPNPQP